MKSDYAHARARTRDFPRDELYWNFGLFVKENIYDFIFQHIRRPLESVRLTRHIDDSIEEHKIMQKDFQTTKDILYWQPRIELKNIQEAMELQELDQPQTKVDINICMTIRSQIMTRIKENLDSELYES